MLHETTGDCLFRTFYQYFPRGSQKKVILYGQKMYVYECTYNSTVGNRNVTIKVIMKTKVKHESKRK